MFVTLPSKKELKGKWGTKDRIPPNPNMSLIYYVCQWPSSTRCDAHKEKERSNLQKNSSGGATSSGDCKKGGFAK